MRNPIRLVQVAAVLLAFSWMGAAEAVGPAVAVPPPSSVRARDLFDQAAMLAQDKNYREAIPLLEEVLRQDPTLKAGWESLGWAYWRVGRENDAIALWERLRSLDPSQPLAYNLLAKAATARGDLVRATELNQRSLELQPDQYAVKYDLARILLWRGQTETSIAMFDTALKTDPNRLDIMLDLARALSGMWRYEQALPLWHRLSGQTPNNLEYQAMEGLCLLHGNKPEPARALFEKVLASKPDHLVALEGMAYLEEFGPDSTKAAPYYRRLIQAQPDPREKETVRCRLINLLVRLHRADPLGATLTEPLALVKDRLEYNPKSVDALLLRGELLLMDVKYGGAEDQFIEVLEKYNVHNIRAYRGLFETYVAAKRFDLAREQLESLRQFNPLDPYLDYYLARLESTQGRFSAAYEALDRLEAAGRRGAVAVILYHGLTPSRYFPDALAESRFRDQLQAMRQAGFEFVKSGEIPVLFSATNPPPVLAPPPPPPPAPVVAVLSPVPTSGVEKVVVVDAGATLPVARRHVVPLRALSSRPASKPEADVAPAPVVAPPPAVEPPPVAAPFVAAPAAPAIPIRVSINFDDGRKDTMALATGVARDFGLVFSHHIPCGYIMQNNPFIITWEQLESYAATGCWEFGSHFVKASILTPIDAFGQTGHALPNLIEEKNRQETLEEYAVRLKHEFADSQVLLRQHTKQPVNFISYPFGDIGQELDTNLQDPVPGILETGRLYYNVGFIQSTFGFAVAGDDPMLYQRHEMDRWMNGSNVVEYVYAHHPLFLAQRTRAEYAALDGKQYRAMESVEWLEKNGYPPALLEETRRYVQTRLSGGYVRPAAAAAAEKAGRVLDSLKPRLRGEGEYFRDNQDRMNWRLYGGGGLNIGERLALDAKAGVGQLTQKTLASVTNGIQVAPSRNLKVDEASVGVRGTLLFVSDPTHPITDYLPHYISAGFMQRQFSGDAQDSVTALEAETQFRPLLPLDVMVRYERDIVPAALAVVDGITYDLWSVNGEYRLRDWWNLNGSGLMYSFSDNNTRDHFTASSSWLLYERLGFWAGLRYYYANAEEDRESYWTPYELSRYSVEGRLLGHYRRAYYHVKINFGYGKENVRPEEERRFVETQARAQAEGWDAGAPPSTDWEFVFGASASTRIHLQDQWELNGEISYNENPNYNELSVFGGVSYAF